MKAGWYEHFGKASDVLVVGEQPTPVADTDQVLVRLKTSAVNPSDVKKRAGAFADLLDEGLVIPNSDGAGVIESVGPGVDSSRIGQRVWIYQAQHDRSLGTSAEYIAIDSQRAVVLPESVSFAVGACLGIPAMTAHRCVFADGPVDGQIVLVTGGAGRVAYYAIQWAKQAGATVVATVSNGRDEQACLDVGAHAVVNHRSCDWAQQVLKITQGKKVDRVIDVEFGANLEQILKLIRLSGTIVTYASSKNLQPTLPFLQMMYLDLTLRMVIVYSMPERAKRDAINDIDRYLRDGRLQHRIAHTVPLGDHARAHELVEAGSCGGCVVVRIAAD